MCLDVAIILYLLVLTNTFILQCQMDGIKVEPSSEEEIRPTGSDVQHINMNQEEGEPVNFVEVKCEPEVRQVVVLGCKGSSQGVRDYHLHLGVKLVRVILATYGGAWLTDISALVSA
jgi:hypothetical protein